MTKNWIAINIVLLLAAGLLGWQLYGSIKRFREENDPAKIVPVEDVKKKITAAESGLPPLQPAPRYNAPDYEAIAGKNLFAESRGVEETTEQAQPVEIPEMKVKPILVGTLIAASGSTATIVDPTTPDPRRRTQTKRIGDAYQGYTITEIAPTRMVLESGGRREIIPLYDGSKRAAQGGKTPVIATRVVNFGGQGSGGVVTGTRAVGGASSAEAPRQAQGARTVVPSSQPGGAVQPGVVAQPRQGSEAVQQPNETRDAQGRRVLRTPWGDIVRPPEPPPREE